MLVPVQSIAWKDFVSKIMVPIMCHVAQTLNSAQGVKHNP